MQHLRLNTKNVILLCVVILAGWGMVSRYMAYVDLHKQAEERAVPSVITIEAKNTSTSEKIVLPANVQAWHEALIFARTNGYVKRWVTDIGADVKAGDLIAEIETPEVDAQLRQAEADYETARANNDLAQSTAKRWQALLKTQSVSQQETDEKVSDAKAKEALMAASLANVKRLKELESFNRITAPFDGTITARNVDNGALINAGSGAKELFHIADVSKLRVYVQVPQAYAISLKPGFPAVVHFSEYPDKNFTAKLVGSAGAIDPASRTLLMQFELENKDHELMSGGYAEVHIDLPRASGNMVLPVNVLLFRSDGLRVAVVKDNHVQLKTITIARDFGNEFEVNSGIEASDKIIVNPPDSLESGQEVRIVMPKEEPKKDKE